MPRTAPTLVPDSFDQLRAQAAESVRRDARRLREVAERYREQYRGRLEEWVQLRARVDHRLAAARGTAPSPEVLRAKQDALAKELAGLQGSLKRIDVAARQLELVITYLSTDDAQASEPTLSDADLSPASISLKIIQAQEAERQRLAEEVHDGPAQVLTNAIFQVEYLDRVIDDSPETARAELAFLRTMLREGLDEVRSFIAALRPPSVDVGLGQAITAVGAEFASKHGITVEVSVPGIDARVPTRGQGADPARRAGGAPERAQARGRHRGPYRPRRGPPRHRRQRPGLRRHASGLGDPQLRPAVHARARRADGLVTADRVPPGEGTRILLRIPEVR